MPIEVFKIEGPKPGEPYSGSRTADQLKNAYDRINKGSILAVHSFFTDHLLHYGTARHTDIFIVADVPPITEDTPSQE